MRTFLVLLFTLLVAAPAQARREIAAAREVVAAGAPGALALGADGRRSPRAALAGTPAPLARGPVPRRQHHQDVRLHGRAPARRRGRLSLDDPVARHLPGLVPGGEAITLRQLLSHTSGLAEYGSQPEILRSLEDPSFTWGGRALAELAAAPARRARLPLREHQTTSCSG